MQLRSVLILGVVVLVLGGCASRSGAPVTERGVSARQSDAEFREIIAGDTLYSIAWESGRDYRELAQWNRISPPYTIKPGQKIRLRPPANTEPPKTDDAPSPTAHVVQRGDTLFSIASRYDVAVADLAAWNNLAAPYTIKPGQSLRVVGAAASRSNVKGNLRKPRPQSAPVAPKPPTKQKTNAKFAAREIGAWNWPTEGALLTRFNSGGSKGVDVAGKAGQPIVAAASGTVVYQGSGLRGYGQLIIIKHNTDFLSAYAHCNKIVVREGNVIKRGQKIAEMGSTGTDRVKLHFEIRYRGTPVDPLDHLPKR